MVWNNGRHRRRCGRCGKVKPVCSFARGDLTCLLCRRQVRRAAADAAAREAAAAAAGPTTIPLRGDRLLRVSLVPGAIVLSEGFAVQRVASPAVSVLGRVRVPLAKLVAVTDALAKAARAEPPAAATS